MAYVACGRFDGYWQRELNYWDIAAGIIIINEAGGLINKIDLSQTKNLDVITSTPDIHQKMLKIGGVEYLSFVLVSQFGFASLLFKLITIFVIPKIGQNLNLIFNIVSNF